MRWRKISEVGGASGVVSEGRITARPECDVASAVQGAEVQAEAPERVMGGP